MPSLDNAYVRLARGGEHVVDLKRIHDETCSAQAKATIVHGKHGMKIGNGEMARVMEVQSGKTPIPDRLRVLIGDAANSFRSALNYLIYQLAVLDSGPGERRNQFPIEDTPQKFAQSSRAFLKGVSATHIAAIELLQPYNACEWIGALARLSNFDKHDDLIFVAHDYLVHVNVGEAATDPANPKSMVRPMHMDVEPVLHIELGDRLPLVQTLETIQSQVTRVLNTFKSEFK